MSAARKNRPGSVITWTLLFLGGVVMVVPFAYMLGGIVQAE